MKFIELEKLLLKNGWKLDRIKGSHYIYVKEGMNPIPVPNHKGDIKIGTLNTILKQAGLK